MSSRETDWAEWLRSASAGNSEDYRRFLASVAPYVRAVVHSCWRGGRAEAEIEDVVQEVLLAIHLKRGTWDRSRPVKPWVAAIARHKLIDFLRRHGRHVAVPIEDVLDTLQAEDDKPELFAAEMDALLRELKPQQEQIVRSISLNGQTVRETAERLQMAEGTVRVNLHRALKALGILYRSRSRED